MPQSGNCPICDTLVVPEGNAEELKFLKCPNCQSILIPWSSKNNHLVFEEAPQIGEDWEDIWKR